jgi:ubiquinone biosynthesis protein UbiJ
VVKRSALELLREMGRTAAPTTTALEALARHDPSDAVRDLAKKATEQIRGNQPAPVEVSRLREELEKLRKSQDELQDKLKQFEKMERKAP